MNLKCVTNITDVWDNVKGVSKCTYLTQSEDYKSENNKVYEFIRPLFTST